MFFTKGQELMRDVAEFTAGAFNAVRSRARALLGHRREVFISLWETQVNEES